MRRGGSIAIGRGTTRKGSGSVVEAVGVTAAGFFVPPVPQQHASIDGFDAVRPILVTNPSLFSSSSLYDSVFIPHSLAPDK